MPEHIITCDTSGTGSGPSSGSGLGPDFITSVNEAGQHGLGVLEKLREQRSYSRFCDVTVDAGGVHFVAHRAVLAACSPYFESVLNCAQTKRQHITVQTNPTGHIAFDIVLRYMYSGTVSLTDETVADVLRLSERFAMGHLRDRCTEFLQSRLSCRSCFKTRDLAEGLGLAGLVRTIDAFIVATIVEIVQDDNVLELPMTHLEELLRRTMPLTEIARMRLICRWADHRSEERHKVVSSVLSLHVQWQKVVESSELFHFLHKSNSCTSVSPSDWCRFQVLQILKDKCLLPDIYFEQLAFLQELFASPVSDHHQDTSILDNNEGSTFASHSLSVEISCGDDEDVEPDDGNDIENSSTDSAGELPAPIIQTAISVKPKQASRVTRSASLTGKISKAESSQKTTKAQEAKNAGNRRRTLRKYKGTCVEGETAVEPEITESGITRDASISESSPLTIDSNVSNNVIDSARTISLKKSKRLKRIETQGPECLTRTVNRQPLAVCNTSSTPPLTNKPEKRKRRVNTSRAVKCKQCGYMLRSDERLRIHVKTAHGDRRKFSCNLCKYETCWNRQFYRHMRSSHFPGPPYICDTCPFTCESMPQLVLHRMDHTDERPFKCSTCGVCFKLKSNLITHKRCHSGEKPFSCPHCSRSFTTKGTMEQHIVTHSSLRSYLCDLCGFSTKFQSHLISHRRIHTGDVYKCQYSGCSYSTPKRSQLACHSRAVHLHVRSYVCTECGRAFVERSHLVRHERLHQADKPFACDQCTYTSTRRDKLKEHQQKRHSDVNSAAAIDVTDKTSAGPAAANETRTKRPRRKAAKKIKSSTGSSLEVNRSASESVAGTSMLPAISSGDTTMPMMPLDLVVGVEDIPVIGAGDHSAVSLVASGNLDTGSCVRSSGDQHGGRSPIFDILSLEIEAYKLVVGGDGSTVLQLTSCNMDSRDSVADGRQQQQLGNAQFSLEPSVEDGNQMNDAGASSSLWIVTQ